MGINTFFIEFILIIKDNVMVQKKGGIKTLHISSL